MRITFFKITNVSRNSATQGLAIVKIRLRLDII